MQEEVGLSTLNFIIGRVRRTFFKNEVNFYQVLLVQILKTDLDFPNSEIVITGTLGTLTAEDTYRFCGKLVTHPKYGEQFQVESYAQELPSSETGLIAYLSSKKFPHVGKKTAEKIVEALGKAAITKILENPRVLASITKLSKANRDQFVKILQESNGQDQVMVKLNELGFGTQLSLAIFNKYQEKTLEKIKENPYQLVEDIEGIGFQKADLLAEKLGIAPDDQMRIRAAINHELLQHCVSFGDTYLEAQELLMAVQNTLEMSRNVQLDQSIIAEQIIEQGGCGQVGQVETKIFEKSLFCAELGIANSLAKLLRTTGKKRFSATEIKKNLAQVERQLRINYGQTQQEAIVAAINSPFFILTGGPGTGKTTVIQGIVELFAKLNKISLNTRDYAKLDDFPILLAAPTGRAARRMNETTGLMASTIHRLLGLTQDDDLSDEERGQLSGKLLIVDEFSMVDTWLANLLFKAVPGGMKVIIVGDADQLPSVGPGQVLNDLLQIEEIPQAELTEIYRQGQGSSIISLAHQIKSGELPADFTSNQADRSFFACSANNVENYIRQIILKAVEKGMTIHDFQILAPMYRGPAGINALNVMLQNILNPNQYGQVKEVHARNGVYRIGDKVLQLVNDSELNVFNGDFGVITGIKFAKESVDHQDELIIDFEGCEVHYLRPEWNKIMLSYACSIHKAQGSEFKLVILPLVMNFKRMLRRNLLYTAITRSKEALILLGEPEAFKLSVERVDLNRRTYLKERLHQVGFDAKLKTSTATEDESDPQACSPILTKQKINQELVDPLIGMEELTPLNFRNMEQQLIMED